MGCTCISLMGLGVYTGLFFMVVLCHWLGLSGALPAIPISGAQLIAEFIQTAGPSSAPTEPFESMDVYAPNSSSQSMGVTGRPLKEMGSVKDEQGTHASLRSLANGSLGNEALSELQQSDRERQNEPGQKAARSSLKFSEEITRVEAEN